MCCLLQSLLVHKELNLDISPFGNRVDSDQLAMKPADQDPHYFPFSMWIHGYENNLECSGSVGKALDGGSKSC